MIIFLGWTSDGIRTSLARPLATGGRADRAGASQPEEVERAAQAHFDRPSPLAKSYIGYPAHLNPLQQFVLTCAMFLAALLAHPIHFSIDVLLLTHDATPAKESPCHP
jgi:hypothetical protein